MFKPSADFLLRVSGMSMKDIGILDGDLLAVHKTQDVRNGQVVVARIDDEVTVKRLKKQGNTVQLLPENNEFSRLWWISASRASLLKDWRSALSATVNGCNLFLTGCSSSTAWPVF